MLPLPIIILLILSAFALSRAEVISASLGTGLKADGTSAEALTDDLRWTVRDGATPEMAARVGEAGILAGTQERWIAPPPTIGLGGRYTFRSTPYLEFPETSTPRLQLRLTAIHSIYSVRVNGQHQHNSITGLNEVDTVIVEEGLHPGLNELEIIVFNAANDARLWCKVLATHTPPGASESLSAALEEDMLNVSWPARDPAFSLTYNATLDDALDWVPILTPPDLIGNEFSLKFPTVQEKGFYRLVKSEITKPPVTRITVDPTSSGQPVYLASNGEYTAGAISTLVAPLNGAVTHRLYAGDSFDPRGGDLVYDWKIFYPSTVNGGAEFTGAGAGLSGAQASALEIGVNALPDIGTNLWRARLTVTSDAGDLPLSRVAEFNFKYAPNVNPAPVVTVVVNPASSEPEEVRTGCTSVDGCTINPTLAHFTNVFDASASVDPRGGTLSYAWEIRYPTTVQAGAVYSHPGLVINGPVVTIAPNSLPDAGEFNWRARLTITSTLPDGNVLSTAIRFRFQYLESALSVYDL